MKRVIYKIFTPEGQWVASAIDRKNAKQVLGILNSGVDEWKYDLLHKMAAACIDVNSFNASSSL